MTVTRFDFLHALAERLHASADARIVYGDRVQAGHKTIIPVARVAYGFGGGYESGGAAAAADGTTRGEGGGGGIMVTPVGVVEVTAEATRFVPLGGSPPSRLVMLGLFVLGVVVGRISAGRGK
jgi:uncharacterized spore protein YtfJ